MNKKFKELLSNTAIFAISNLLSKILLMLLLPVYTNKLTPAEYGAVELATNISLLVIPFVSLAIQDAVFRFTVDKSIEEKEVFKCSFWVLIAGSVLLVFFSSLLYFYEPLHEWRWWFCAFSIFSMTRTTVSLYAKGTDKTKVFAIDGFLYNAVLAGFNILFLCVFSLKIEGYFGALVISQLISIAYLYSQVSKPSLRYLFSFPLNKVALGRMLRYSSPLVLNSISWNLTHTVDRVMLERMRSTAEVGVYSAASKIPSLISTIMNIFISAWTISAIRNYDDPEGKKFFSQVFGYVQILLIIVTLSVLLLNNHIVVLLFGPEFREAISYTPILMIATSILFYSNYFGPIFSSFQKSKTLMNTTLVGTVFNIVFNYILIGPYGIYGACIATLFSNLVVSASRVILARELYPFPINWKSFFIGWLLVGIAVATVISRFYSELIVVILLFMALFLYKSSLMGLVHKLINNVRG